MERLPCDIGQAHATRWVAVHVSNSKSDEAFWQKKSSLAGSLSVRMLSDRAAELLLKPAQPLTLWYNLCLRSIRLYDLIAAQTMMRNSDPAYGSDQHGLVWGYQF